MLTSVYCLLFKDPELKMLDPCNMKIGTYNKDAVQIVGSCKFYLVHLNTGQEWWMCIVMMYNYPCTCTYTAKNKISLSTTKSK